MAGAFSGHLLHASNNGPAQLSTPTIVTSGAMSFDTRVHGTTTSSLPSFFSHSLPPLSEDGSTAIHVATLKEKLNKRLGPEYISQRPGPGGGPKLTYVEGWKIINLANEVFGFNGWSSSIVSIATDFVDYNEESKKFNVGVTAIVRVTLRDGAYHEDVGYGILENGKSKAAALDKCKKEAITDALKRTLRNFGNLLGNCLYDKSYTQEVVKIKVPAARFNKNDLYRRPEFEERIPNASVPAPHDQPAAPETPSIRHEESLIKYEDHQSEIPIMYVPRHMRQEVAAAAQRSHDQSPASALATTHQGAPMHDHMHASTSGSRSTATEVPANQGPSHIETPEPGGLATPIQTPVHAQRQPPPRALPPQAVATSPLARTTATADRRVSFVEPTPVLARVGGDAAERGVHDTGQTNVQGANEEDDAFPLSTQDDAFLATVDLGEGDLGRPIDFDEGMGAVGMQDASELELELDNAERSPAVLPQREFQVRDCAGSGSGAGSSSGGSSKATTRHDIQLQPIARSPILASANTEPNVSASKGQLQGLSHTAFASSMPVGTSAQDTRCNRSAITPIGGFHLPYGVKPAMSRTPKPVVPACVRATSGTPQTTGQTTALKRRADVMQASSGSLARPPLQGMGLTQRQQQQQNITTRSTSEGHDPKRLRH